MVATQINAARLNGKISNRRVALRVYEQANLFYQKITPDQINVTQPGYDNLLKDFAQSRVAGHVAAETSFPYSQSQENDTMNVNISSSGIAFTCTEELKTGDYLMLRILFISSMTVVLTCCKVVYCKPSNPYENNRHPYSIGAQFINMTAEDSELLNRHVQRRRKQQFIINGSIVASILAFLAAPAHAIGLILGFGHHLLEIILHTLHLGFEVLEMGLDHIIEHSLHSGTHDTQVIVFYVLVTIGLAGLYFFGRKVLSAVMRLSKRIHLYGIRKKSSCLYFWGQQSIMDKIKLVSIGSAAVAGYLFLGI